jgi:mono/diheme cytochrome c family protein
MYRYRTLAATLAPLAFAALGCSEDVGPCKDPNQGRDTVLYGGSIQYGGQAILNASCAPCHSEGAKGAMRQGAPEGLDLDLRPADPEDPEEASGVESNKVTLTQSTISRLRGRQRSVFEERDLIYDQVVRGLMPPDGLGAQFRKAIVSIFDSDDESPCTQGAAYAPTTAKASQEVLRNWLACGAPIVETTSPMVLGRTAGAAGYQYQTCDGPVAPPGDGGVVVPAGDGGTGEGGTVGPVITIQTLQTQIFEGSGACVGCHVKGGVASIPDLSSAAASYESLLNGPLGDCNKAYVTKGDPSKSFLYEVISVDKPSCGDRMPPGGKLTTSQIKLISDWITQGAMR